MVSEGLEVTFYPMTMADEGWPSVYQDIPRTVEVILGSGAPGLEAFLRERSGLLRRGPRQPPSQHTAIDLVTQCLARPRTSAE